jgi:hypothetical protein
MIFAVDFDGTIVEHRYPDIGPERCDALITLKHLQQAGHQIIIWTCRTGEDLAEVVQWCKKNDFKPDAYNCNPDSIPGFGVPKVLADVYIDDRNFPPFRNWQEVRDKYLKFPSWEKHA